MTLIWPAIEQEMKEVWLGGIDGAKDSQLLADNNIRTLVCCNPPLPRFKIRGIEYMVFDSNAVTEAPRISRLSSDSVHDCPRFGL